VTKRARFEAFRARVDAGESIDLAALGDEPDPWLRRACIVYAARQERELIDDDGLARLAAQLGGKLATFIRGMLILRHARRSPGDARRAVDAYGQAWLRERVACETARVPDDRLPNDIFKRPGPHHAYELDAARCSELRGALDALELFGMAEPFVKLLPQYTADDVLAGRAFHDVVSACIAGDDFGLRDYGPMWSRAGLDVTWGELLYPQRNAREEPISPFWADHRPYLPYRVAPASELVDALGELRNPPKRAWKLLARELGDDGDAALIEAWRPNARAELDAFASRLGELAARGASVVTWESEQGWL
jgi:hypothetical protein